MRTLVFLLAVIGSILCLVGCGNYYGCGGADSGSANPNYAGTYTGGFFPGGAAAMPQSTPVLSFALTVSTAGAVTGTVTETSSGHTAAVTGTLIDWFIPCQQPMTELLMDFTLPGEVASHLDGTRNQSVVIHWPFGTRIFQGMAHTQGTLLMDKN